MSAPQTAIFAMGCFWQPDEYFRKLPGVLSTEVGYIGGKVPKPSYERVCTGVSGHAEAVRIQFDPAQTSYQALLKEFWENHDPTTLNSQGPDHGEQYRSAIFCADEAQLAEATASRNAVAKEGLWGPDPITTVIQAAPEFWPAEDYHQKYLMKRGITQCHLPSPPRGRKA
jgi:peptide-methionine (S)-S-oxide reductase